MCIRDRSSSTGSSAGESTDGENEDTDSEGDEEESWIDWLKRTAGALDHQVKKGTLVDSVTEQRRRKWRWAGQGT